MHASESTSSTLLSVMVHLFRSPGITDVEKHAAADLIELCSKLSKGIRQALKDSGLLQEIFELRKNRVLGLCVVANHFLRSAEFTVSQKKTAAEWILRLSLTSKMIRHELKKSEVIFDARDLRKSRVDWFRLRLQSFRVFQEKDIRRMTEQELELLDASVTTELQTVALSRMFRLSPEFWLPILKLVSSDLAHVAEVSLRSFAFDEYKWPRYVLAAADDQTASVDIKNFLSEVLKSLAPAQALVVLIFFLSSVSASGRSKTEIAMPLYNFLFSFSDIQELIGAFLILEHCDFRIAFFLDETLFFDLLIAYVKNVKDSILLLKTCKNLREYLVAEYDLWGNSSYAQEHFLQFLRWGLGCGSKDLIALRQALEEFGESTRPLCAAIKNLGEILSEQKFLKPTSPLNILQVYALRRWRASVHSSFQQQVTGRGMRSALGISEDEQKSYHPEIHWALACDPKDSSTQQRTTLLEPRNFEEVLLQLTIGWAPYLYGARNCEFLSEHLGLIRSSREAEECLRILAIHSTAISRNGIQNMPKAVDALYVQALEDCQKFIKDAQSLVQILKYLPARFQGKVIAQHAKSCIGTIEDLAKVSRVLASRDALMVGATQCTSLIKNDSDMQKLLHLLGETTEMGVRDESVLKAVTETWSAHWKEYGSLTRPSLLNRAMRFLLNMNISGNDSCGGCTKPSYTP